MKIIYLLLLFTTISKSNWTIIDSTQLRGISSYVDHFYLDNNDNIWFAASRREIYKFNGANTVYYDANNTPISFWAINCITQGANGDMYFGNYTVTTKPHDKISVIKFDGENWEPFDNTNSPMLYADVNDILATDNDEFWVATYMGLYHYKNGKWKSYFEDENEYRRDIHKLAIDKNNKLYIANNYRELYTADLNKTNIKFNKVATPYTQQAGALPCNIDSLNNLWLGAIYKREGSNWVNYDTMQLPTVASRDKKLYAQSKRIVYEYKNDSHWEEVFGIPDSLGSLIVLNAKDSKGNFWFTSGNTLVKYTPETNSVKKETNVKIYPNPSQNTIIINAEEPITKLALYSLNLSKINEYPANYTTTQEVDISIIPSGIYFIKVNDDLIKFVRE